MSQSLAILTDQNREWKPERFEYNFFQTELVYNYRTYKILEQDEAVLKKSKKPFALAVLASLYTMRSKRSQDKRFKFKIDLTEMLLKRNYSQARIDTVFQFVHAILRLSDEMKQDLFMEEVHKMATANKKRLKPITDFEEAVLRKGKQEIARNMKQRGLDLQLIAEVTGLDLKTIDKL